MTPENHIKHIISGIDINACMSEICQTVQFPEKLMEFVENELKPMRGNKSLLMTIEEIQELLVEMKHITLNMPSKDSNHLTEEFTDCIIMTGFLSYLFEIPLQDITDVESRLHEILSQTDDTAIRDMVIGCIYMTDAGIQRAELMLYNVCKQLSKYMRHEKTKEELTECLKDMQIILYCIGHYFNIHFNDIKQWSERKVEKTMKRNNLLN